MDSPRTGGGGALLWGAIFGAVSVGLGAFATHALRPHLSPESLTWVETAARLTGLHAVALIALAGVADRISAKGVRVVTVLFVLGVFLFAGSLVALGLSEWLTGQTRRWIGIVTPLGGVCWILAWGRLAVEARRRR